MLDAIERIVKAGSGLSASEVAKAAALPQPRVAAALKELKLGKRIFQGGDRRFARYAADARTAEQASATARKNAKGPVPRSKAPVEAPRGAKKRLAEPEAPKARSRKRGANGQAQASAAAA